MTVYSVLIAGQSNVGRHTVSELPSHIQSHSFTRVYIWNNDGPYWGVLDPGSNTGFPTSPTTWGVETAFAYNFEKEYPNDILLIIKSAKGETSSNPSAGIDWHPSSTGEMFDLTAQRITAAKAALAQVGIDASPETLLWVHGETDAMSGAPYYQPVQDIWASAMAYWEINEVITVGVNSTLPHAAAVNAGLHLADAYLCGNTRVTSDGVHDTPDTTLMVGAGLFSLWESV